MPDSAPEPTTLTPFRAGAMRISTELRDNDELVARFLLTKDRENTRRAYRNDLEQFFGRDEVYAPFARKASPEHVNLFVETLRDEGLATSTINRKLAAIKGFFSWCEDRDIIDKNPANRSLIRAPRTTSSDEQQVVFLSFEDANKLVRATSRPGLRRVYGEAKAPDYWLRDQVIILVLVNCLLRRSEAAALNVDSLEQRGAYWVLNLGETKGGSSEYVKAPDFVANKILKMIRHYNYEEGPLFRSFSTNHSGGNRLSEQGIYNVVSRTAERAGLDQVVGAHTLRHTGCMIALEKGSDVERIKRHARHKSLETTMKYVRHRDTLASSAADTIAVTGST